MSGFAHVEFSRGNFREWLEDDFSANLSRFHGHDVDLPSPHSAFFRHNIRTYGFAF